VIFKDSLRIMDTLRLPSKAALIDANRDASERNVDTGSVVAKEVELGWCAVSLDANALSGSVAVESW
jgi:hypothetical protein